MALSNEDVKRVAAEIETRRLAREAVDAAAAYDRLLRYGPRQTDRGRLRRDGFTDREIRAYHTNADQERGQPR